MKYEKRFYPAKAQRGKGKIISAFLANSTGIFYHEEREENEGKKLREPLINTNKR